MKRFRREFIKKSAITMGAIGLGALYGNEVNGQSPPDPEPKYLNEEFTLWPEDSKNNGSNANYVPKVRIYYPVLRNMKDRKLPVVLICPGGGYYVQAPHEGQPFAELLAMHGIIGAVLTYRVFPDRYPGSYADACRAIRLLRDKSDLYNIDKEKVGIMGFSAGGHLASTVATQPELYSDPEDTLSGIISARPDRLMLGYPVISFVDSFAHMGSAHSLLGDEPDESMLMKLSNNYHVTSDNPPVFLFHTADDKGVPVQNSLRFADACIEKGVPVSLHVFPKGEHGVGMALEDPSLKIWTENLLGFLNDWVL